MRHQYTNIIQPVFKLSSKYLILRVLWSLTNKLLNSDLCLITIIKKFNSLKKKHTTNYTQAKYLTVIYTPQASCLVNHFKKFNKTKLTV